MTTAYGAPLRRAVLLLVAGLLVAAGAALLGGRGEGAVLWAPAAVLLLAAARDFWCRPALTLGPEGFRYVVGLQRREASWGEVTAVRVRVERHFLAFGSHLEVDLSDDTLIVLSSLQLGTPADEVAAAMEADVVRCTRPSS